MTTELEGCVNDMCNISEVILERGLAEGLEQGLEQGLERGLEQGIEKNQLDNIAKLMKKLNLTEEAMDMLDIEEENRGRYHEKLKK